MHSKLLWIHSSQMLSVTANGFVLHSFNHLQLSLGSGRKRQTIYGLVLRDLSGIRKIMRIYFWLEFSLFGVDSIAIFILEIYLNCSYFEYILSKWLCKCSNYHEHQCTEETNWNGISRIFLASLRLMQSLLKAIAISFGVTASQLCIESF